MREKEEAENEDDDEKEEEEDGDCFDDELFFGNDIMHTCVPINTHAYIRGCKLTCNDIYFHAYAPEQLRTYTHRYIEHTQVLR